LRQAIREMFAISVTEAAAANNVDATDGNLTSEAALAKFASERKTRFAFISESLGSYIVHDALAQAVLQSQVASRERSALQPNTAVRTMEAVAPIIVICGASQVHMFANQLALLRFSELKVLSVSGAQFQSIGSNSPEEGEDGIQGRSHFFRGCPATTTYLKEPSKGGQFAAEQVVAYHDPDDLLTYYTSDRPGEVGVENKNTTNVVLPYASTIIPFLLVDPAGAHTDQPKQNKIMDMVVCGRGAGKDPTCE
jgi:hypothetical protein